MFFDNLFDDFNPFGSYSYRQPRPQTASMFRNDNRSIMLRKILNDDYNYLCFDCHTELNELEYFDIKNGIFLCYDCAKEHNKLSKEISQPMTGNLRNMEEKDLNVEMTEEPIVDETIEVVAEEAEPVLKRKRKFCCKKANKSDCKAKNPVCAAIVIGAVCCTVVAAAGCAAWFLSKCCEDKK